MAFSKNRICWHMTGNTEEIADIVAEAFENMDIEVEINECTPSRCR